jgi:hypothetical protein
MSHTVRPKAIAAVALLAATLALGASWLLAGADAPAQETETVPEGEAGAAVGSASTPLPDFLPSEELPAGSAVAFPTDI